MTLCPYENLLEQQILGELIGEDSIRLSEHTEKCSHCQAAFSDLNKLEVLLESQAIEIEQQFKSSRPDLLARIQKEIRNSDDLVTPRRLRRLNSRFILYTTQLVAVLMIVLTYVASMASVMTLKRREQVRFTKNEIRALLAVTRTYKKVNQSYPQAGNAQLVEQLSQTHIRESERKRPYFNFDPNRVKNGLFVDPWSRPYIYQVGNSGIKIYSLGPNGRDESGGGDDIVPPQ
jgi:type II secretory pathway pseudopilin PulG